MSRVFCIGDIHGCYDALITLVNKIPILEEDYVIALGDFIDRGPNSAEVVSWLLERYKAKQLVPILGNHEEMLRYCVEGGIGSDAYRDWLSYGGKETLQSYGVEPSKKLDLPSAFPPDHWEFLTGACWDHYEMSEYLFVHANALPHLPLKHQPDEVLRWTRFTGERAHESGKILICGHTPQPGAVPNYLGHSICIDTGVYMPRGRLTCMEMGSELFWQSAQDGSFREMRFPAVPGLQAQESGEVG